VLRPFEVSREELLGDLDTFVDATYDDLESSYLVLPKGEIFVEYPRFRDAYETLKRKTSAFRVFTPPKVWVALREDALVFVVMRAILGITPPEWADLAATELGSDVNQGAARTLDRKCRTEKGYVARLGSPRSRKSADRIGAMVEIACRYVKEGAPPGAADTVHRLDKADTAQGLSSLQRAADFHVPFAVVLYERHLGRPFASHRDSVSEHVGDAMEGAIESRLHNAHVTYRKIGKAERIPGFDQAPDFVIPDEFAPRVVIEAKITNDDGTARDKFTRIVHLSELSRERRAEGQEGFEVVACIDGRGFGVRREDMRRLLKNTSKVFTLRTLDQLVSRTQLSQFAVPDLGIS
jgi:hypothetical protein